MRTIIARSSMVLSAFLLLGTVASADGWQEHGSLEGRFAVELPGAVEPLEQTVESPIGPIAMRGVYSCTGMVAYSVQYCDYPAWMVEAGNRQEMLDGACMGSAQACQGELVSKESIEIYGHPGREVLINALGGAFQIRSRILLVGNRLYILTTVRPASQSGTDSRFFGSFRLD